jgi:2-methylcitrate dehydratase PrpD
MNETRTLVKFLAEMNYDNLSPEARATAKLCVLDTIGVGLFGAQMEWARIVAEMVTEADCVGESTVWGRNVRTAAQYAAMANATAAHGIEMDDLKPAFRVHTGALAVPAAMAATEKVQADGKRLLTAIVAGYEASFRVSRSVRKQMERGIHSPGHFGIWGSVAAASKALDLNQEQMLDAFGIAGSMASGIFEFSNDPLRTMVKRLHGGWPSHSGVIAALLGQKGLTGPSTVLEGQYGYCRVFAGEEEPRLEDVTKDLGTSFQILDWETKSYAAWGASHLCIDAVNELQARYRIEPQEIEKVIIGGFRTLFMQHEMREPQSIMAAQYSLPFVTAMAFFKDLRDPSVWKEEVLRDEAILGLVQKIEWYLDEEVERIHRETYGYGGVKLTVKLRDSREFHTTVYHAKGSQGNPMTPQEIHDKFSFLVGHVLPRNRVEEIARTVDSLERVDNVRQLGDLLLL